MVGAIVSAARRPARLLLLSLPALLWACGEATDVDLRSSRGLLARRPDVVFENPGQIVPGGASVWGVHQLAGWSSERHATADGRACGRTLQRVVQLMLPAGAPRDRRLELELWSLDALGQAGAAASVRLNGFELGAIALGESPRVHALDAPAACWRPGPNVIEFESPVVGVAGERPSRWLQLGLASVRYGEARRVRFAPDGIELAPGTGLRYLFEPLGREHLLLAAKAGGAGELELSFGLVDLESGSSRRLDSGARFALDASTPLRRAVPLPAVEGGLLQLDLVWHGADGAALALSSLRLGGGAERPLPPVIFISIDTLAARHMSVYGYSRETTPHLEEFARDAVVFEDCAANAPWTLPSYLSVMSGLYPESHRLEPETRPGEATRVWDRWQLAENRWTMAESFRSLGYRTGAFVDTPWVTETYNLQQGFDMFDTSAEAIPREDSSGGFEYIAKLARAWLTAPAEQPSFLFLQAVDVHAPFLPKAPFRGRFTDTLDEREPRMVKAGCSIFSYGAIQAYLVQDHFQGGEIPAEMDVEEVIALYDEEILALDAAFGELVAALEQDGILDDALIVFTADHGEAFDHDFYGHSGTLYDSILWVPLIVKFPQSRWAGARIHDSVQLTDLFPTLYAYVSGNAAPDHLHGRSLLPVLDGAPLAPRAVFAEGGLIRQSMAELDGWKLIELFPARDSGPDTVLTHPRAPRDLVVALLPELEDGILTPEKKRALEQQADFPVKVRAVRHLLQGPYYELYNTREDPEELIDLFAQRPQVAQRMRAVLEREQARRDHARAQARPVSIEVELDAAVLDELRKLGYVDD